MTLPPTATSATSIHAPTLGSTAADFLARYQVVAGTQDLVYNAAIAGQKVEIALGPDLPDQSRDGVAHVAVVTVGVPADALSVEHWNEPLADQVAQAFLPSDAQFQRIVTVHGAQDHIYTSASIAATFTPGQFVTDGNTPVPVGTLTTSATHCRYPIRDMNNAQSLSAPISVWRSAMPTPNSGRATEPYLDGARPVAWAHSTPD